MNETQITEKYIREYNSEFEIINECDRLEPPAGSIEKLKENAQRRNLEIVVETIKGSEELTIGKT